MNRDSLIALSLLIAALGVAALALPLLQQWWLRWRSARTLDAALARQGAAAGQGAKTAVGEPGAASSGGAVPAAGRQGAMPAANASAAATGAVNASGASTAPAAGAGRAGGVGAGGVGVGGVGGAGGARARLGAQLGGRFDERWLASPIGKAIVGPEELRLLEQCGWYGPKARAIFGGLRLCVPLLIAAVLMLWRLPESLQGAVFTAFGGFAVSFLAFKSVLRRRAAGRMRQLDDELPVLVDMLRLLQGVGMSIDQSLQLIVTEFGSMLPVLGPELKRANDQFASGRSREQTLQRIGKLFESEDLRNLIMLLNQVDRFGGAVQEPLKLFGLRLQEARKMRLKEKVGRLTVKMTGVMVVSLLPVLLIVTAGPGFLGVIRMLAKFAGDMQ
ncbi:type II secretion system F family protein [Cupriavidus cauae]|uniref:Type II secretion system F family protein n=1 Tax=Cupriavidus cauae TaxID=2608999 RepID=A0A5M8B3A3_9BURK|nr:type II secretion system F family protein [Cupriavidus cauae]KAA6129699.1 type II secretion system F family protein [Cupriavidus cauae]